MEGKEYYEGKFKGKDIRFNRVFRGHRFTDDECESLLAGDEIEITDLVGKTGKTYGVKGKLTQQEYNGHKFYGFEQQGFLSGGSGGIPASWSGHQFTDREKKRLEDGETIDVKDAVSKKSGKTFSCQLKYGKRDDGTTGLIPVFSKIPDSWSGHVFTEDEKTLLEDGRAVEITATSKKTGKQFTCKLTYGEREDGTTGLIPHFG